MSETVEEPKMTPTQNGTPPSDTKGGRKSRGPSRSAVSAKTETPAKTEEKTETSEVIANGDDAPSTGDAGKDVAKGKKGKKTPKKEKTAEVNGEDATVAKKKPVKKKIPSWATLPATTSASLKPGQKEASTKGSIDVIIDAVESNANEKGLAAQILIKKHIAKVQPNWPRMTWKNALKKALAKGCIKQGNI